MASPVMDSRLAWDLAALAAGLDRPDFGRLVLRCVAHACRLRNFGVFMVPDPKRPRPVLSLFEGDLGDYRIRRNAKDSTSQPGYPARLAAIVDAARLGRRTFALERIAEDDPRWPIYRRSGLLEHIACVAFGRRIVYVVNYYRSTADGPITNEEEAALRLLLPLVNELIVARHKLVGVGPAASLIASRRVETLRARGRAGFADLSSREAELLDHLAEGRSLAAAALELAIAENTARTLRARAYRKLGIGCLAELFATLLVDAEQRETG